MPLSPDKENASNTEATNPKNSVIEMKENDRERWHVTVVANANSVREDDSSSSSTSANSENIAIQERVSLLANEKEHIEPEVTDEHVKRTLPKNEGEIHAMKAIGASKMLPDSTLNSTPITGAYAMISLRDGLDEQQMMETDLMSITTNSSANNILMNNRHEDEDESDYYTPEDLPIEQTNRDLQKSGSAKEKNGGTKLVDQSTDTSLDTPQVSSE